MDEISTIIAYGFSVQYYKIIVIQVINKDGVVHLQRCMYIERRK